MLRNLLGYARGILDSRDAAAIALGAFLMGLVVHHLMIYGTLRQIRKEAKAHQMIKEKYKRVARSTYGMLSLLMGLAGVGLILLLVCWADLVKPWADAHTLMMAAMICFILSGFIYEAGLAKSAVEVVRQLTEKPGPKRA